MNNKNINVVRRKVWNIVIDRPFLNCKYIHPLQQRKVAQIIEYLKDNGNVNKIIIFGSSVTVACHNESDVDIYCDITVNEKLIDKYFDFPYDLITNFTVDDRMYEEIITRGVIVYER